MSIWSSIVDTYNDIVSPITDYLGGKISDLGRWIWDSGADIKGFLSDQLHYADEAREWVVRELKSYFSAENTFISQLIGSSNEDTKSWITQRIREIGQDVSSSYSALENWLGGKLQDVGEIIGDITTDIKEGLIIGLTKVGEIIADIPETLERLTRAGMEALQLLPDILKFLPEAIGDTLKKIFTLSDKEQDEFVDTFVKLVKKGQDKFKERFK